MISNNLDRIYRQGQGQAFILPGSGAVDTLLEGLNQNSELRRRYADQAIKERQAFDKGVNDNISNLRPKDYWTRYANEISNDYNALMSQAQELKSKRIDPFSDSDFLAKRDRLYSKARASNELKTQYDDFYKEYGKNPDSYDNGLDVLKSYGDVTLDGYIDNGFNPPVLQRRYSLADAVKDSNGQISYEKNNDGVFDTTRVNRTGNVGQAMASLNTPAAGYLIKSFGGDSGKYIGGFPTITEDGRTFYNTKGKQFEDAVINTLATDPEFPNYLASKGYDISSKAAIKSSAYDFAKKQNEAAGKYVSGYADLLENKATTDTTRVFAKEANARANAENARAEKRMQHDQKVWAEEALEKQPDSIATNVLTNIASSSADGGKVYQRPSTSLAAVNVGDAKSPFLPQFVFNAETGIGDKNSASINIQGGQVHIKPVLNFDGGRKILDDESIKKIKEGTYKVNGKSVPKTAKIAYEELLYGTEQVAADPSDPLSKNTSRKIIIPISGQAIDNKFSKKYNREQMFDAAAKSTTDFETRKELLKNYLKTQAPNLADKELDKLAFEAAKQY